MSPAWDFHFLQARTELSSEIQNLCEPVPSQAQIFTLSPSQASPAQAFWFEPAWYTIEDKGKEDIEGKEGMKGIEDIEGMKKV